MNDIAEARMECRINWAGVALLIGLVANLCAGSWFASNLSNRVGTLEVAATRRDDDHELLARMDERIRLMAGDIKELKERWQGRR